MGSEAIAGDLAEAQHDHGDTLCLTEKFYGAELIWCRATVVGTAPIKPVRGQGCG